MTFPRRDSLIACSVLVALLLAAVWSYCDLVESRDRAEEAVNEAVLCRGYEQAIDQLPGSNQAAEPLTPERMDEIIRHAAVRAGFNPDNAIRSIQPSPSRLRAGRSQPAQSTQAQLQNLTLRQIITFLYHLSDGAEDGAGVGKASQIFLTRAEESSGADYWNADSVIVTGRGVMTASKDSREPATATNNQEER